MKYRIAFDYEDYEGMKIQEGEMRTIEALVEAIKKREKDGKVTINDVYASVRDIIFN